VSASTINNPEITIQLTPNARAALDEIQSRLGVSLGEAIGTALGMEAFLLQEVENNDAKIIIEDKNGNRRQLTVKKEEGDGRRGSRS
jgi:hypothetical protein